MNTSSFFKRRMSTEGIEKMNHLRTDSLITGGYKKPLILKKSQTIRKLYKSTTLHKKASLKDEQDEKADLFWKYHEKIADAVPLNMQNIMDEAKKVKKLNVSDDRILEQTKFGQSVDTIMGSSMPGIEKSSGEDTDRDQQANQLIILPDQPFQQKWNLAVFLILIYATVVTPYRVTFTQNYSITWILLDACVDVLFLIDLIFNFLYAYYDENEELIRNRKRIAINYLTTWFLIDSIALFPFSLFWDEKHKHYHSLSRVTRLPRLFKLFKFARLLKITSSGSKLWSWVNVLRGILPKFTVAGERLLALVLTIFIFCHVSACLWVLLAQLEGIQPDSWIFKYGFEDATDFQLYTNGIYFTLTTVTTVGYGDIVPQTTTERWYGILLLILGAMAYSYAISTLTSLITSRDIKETRKKEALELMERISSQCNLDQNELPMYKKEIALNYNTEDYFTEADSLLRILPRHLRNDLKSALNNQLVSKIEVFRGESESFLNYLSTFLKHEIFHTGEYFWKEGEEVTGMYFLLKGSVNLVFQEFNETAFATITKGLQFGDLDIVNGLMKGDGIKTKRVFTAKAQSDGEAFFLSLTDLFALLSKHEESVRHIFRNSELALEHVDKFRMKMNKGLSRRRKRMNQLWEETRKSLTLEAEIESSEKASFDLSNIQGESNRAATLGSMSPFHHEEDYLFDDLYPGGGDDSPSKLHPLVIASRRISRPPPKSPIPSKILPLDFAKQITHQEGGIFLGQHIDLEYDRRMKTGELFLSVPSPTSNLLQNKPLFRGNQTRFKKKTNKGPIYELQLSSKKKGESQ